MPPEREGPRLEKQKHIQAERRLKEAILEGRGNYPGKAEDLERVKRKQKELGPERLRRTLGGGGLT